MYSAQSGYFTPICLVFLTMVCCTAPDAQQIVDAAIEAHGGRKFDSAVIEFDFRERHYRAERSGGVFAYYREFEQDGDRFQDKLTNKGFSRKINGTPAMLSGRDSSRYANSVNSVIYFALLPYRLNDSAVLKDYLGESDINGQPYHKIKITFRQEGGGKDFEDVFVYWFHQETHTMDYLAYRFHSDGGGTRFREALNPRMINGIRIQDYRNYQGPSAGTALAEFDSLFSAGKLPLASEIRLENVTVKYLRSVHQAETHPQPLRGGEFLCSVRKNYVVKATFSNTPIPKSPPGRGRGG